MQKQLSLTNLKYLSLSLVSALTLVTFFPQLSLAQSVNEQDNYQSNEVDSFSGNTLGGGSLNPLDLIHRANLSNGRSVDEFNQDSAENINDAASDFKRRQQEMLLNQPEEQTIINEQ